jgi:hypothetical protein
MIPSDCRNFSVCNASVCPLAPHQGRHLSGERVCIYALASGKAGATERYGSYPEFIEVCRNLPVVVARFPSIGLAVERAAKTPLRFDPNTRLPRRRNAEKGIPGGEQASRQQSTRPGVATAPRNMSEARDG